MSDYVQDEYDVMNLVFWVQRLGKRVHKYEPDSDMVRKAYEFLDRRGMRSPTDVLRTNVQDFRDEQIRVLREALAGAEAHLLIGLDLNEAGLNGRAHHALLGIREALAATEPGKGEVE